MIIQPPKYHYFDPLDIFQAVADTYLPFQLTGTRRHANGWHYGYFNVTWDGIKRLIPVGASAHTYRYLTNHMPPGYTVEKHRQYQLRSTISRLASRMLCKFEHRTEHIHMAQNYVMTTILHHYPTEYGQSGCGGSSSPEGWKIDQEAGVITVTDHRGTSKFNWTPLRNSIADQLEQPQMLRMFA